MTKGQRDLQAATIADAAATAVVIGDLTAVQNTGWGATNEADFDKIWTEHDKLITDVASLITKVNSILLALENEGITSKT